jgi:hypothetical protein
LSLFEKLFGTLSNGACKGSICFHVCPDLQSLCEILEFETM